jgi:hypothetical protein
MGDLGDPLLGLISQLADQKTLPAPTGDRLPQFVGTVATHRLPFSGNVSSNPAGGWRA